MYTLPVDVAALHPLPVDVVPLLTLPPLRNDIDLNRNFPDPIQDAAGALLHGRGTEQPETRAVMNWTMQVGFAASASLHEVRNHLHKRNHQQ